jgi:hypothetical protein
LGGENRLGLVTRQTRAARPRIPRMRTSPKIKSRSI